MDKDDNGKSMSTIEMNYIKTNNYRSYHVDGIFGGITGHAKIYMELFLERAVTPRIISYEVESDGNIGKEINRTGKRGIVREIEAGLIFDIEVAKSMRDWLDEKINVFDEGLKEMFDKQKKDKK